MASNESFTVEEARQYGDKAVELAYEHAGLTLNFSVESLESVDELLSNWHDAGNTCESMPTTVYLFGCYLGEVIIRNVGGTWDQASEKDYEQVTRFPIILEVPGVGRISPLDKVCKLLDNGRADSVLFYCQVIIGLSKRHT